MSGNPGDLEGRDPKVLDRWDRMPKILSNSDNKVFFDWGDTLKFVSFSWNVPEVGSKFVRSCIGLRSGIAVVLKSGQSKGCSLVWGSLVRIGIAVVALLCARLGALPPSVGDIRSAVRGVMFVCEVDNISLSNKLSVRKKQKAEQNKNKTKQ